MHENNKLIEELYSCISDYIKVVVNKDAMLENKIRVIEILEEEVKGLKEVNELQRQSLKIANQMLIEAEFDDPYVVDIDDY
jgi:hypothetical protein